jgi:hypothetical protein
MAIFAGAVDPERYLYHYTTRPAALGSILPQAQLRLGPLTWTNDPRESQHGLVTLGAGGGDGDVVELLREADRLIKGTAKVACFSSDDADAAARPDDAFARGWAHSRMWAQYAAAHSGMCLVFDRAILGRALQALGRGGDLWGGPIVYANRPYLPLDAATLSSEAIRDRGLGGVVEEHVRRHWHALFFVKNEDWATEREYRWVLRGGDSGPAFCSVSEALVGIVVGPAFPDGDARVLDEYAERFGVRDAVVRCVWRNGYPSVVQGARGGGGSGR